MNSDGIPARASALEGLFGIQGLSCWYTPKRPVLSEVEFVAPDGATVGVLGGNGAGKTTFFSGLTEVLAGLSYDAAWFAHSKVSLNEPAFKRSRILVFSEDRSFGTWRFEEYLGFLETAYQRKVDQTWQARLVEEFGFAEHAGRRFAELSSGNRKKASLIAAFLLDLPLLFLDEPSDSLDFMSTELLYRLIVERKQAGKATVVSSHVAETFVRCCDELHVLVDGRMRGPFPVPEDPAEVIHLLDGAP